MHFNIILLIFFVKHYLAAKAVCRQSAGSLHNIQQILRIGRIIRIKVFTAIGRKHTG